MNNAIYIALSRQAGLFRDIDVIANNVANASTPGYKSEQMVFEKYLANDKDEFRRKIAFGFDIATATDFRDGDLQKTDRPLDVALNGEGFFKIQKPDGTFRYTRRGNFSLSNDKTLVTSDGFAVVDDGGTPIRFQQEDTDIEITSDGTIKVRQGNDPGQISEPRGKIAVVSFANPQEMKRVENGLYTTTQAEITDDALVPARVIQGAVEQSNVNPVNEITEMIRVNRSASGVSGFMNDIHELTRRAITAYTRTT